jgi:hypothetical protein
MLDFIPAKEKFLEPGILAAEAQSGMCGIGWRRRRSVDRRERI